MEFLVEFELNVPEGTPESEVQERVSAEITVTPLEPYTNDPGG